MTTLKPESELHATHGRRAPAMLFVAVGAHSSECRGVHAGAPRRRIARRRCPSGPLPDRRKRPGMGRDEQQTSPRSLIVIRLAGVSDGGLLLLLSYSRGAPESDPRILRLCRHSRSHARPFYPGSAWVIERLGVHASALPHGVDYATGPIGHPRYHFLVLTKKTGRAVYSFFRPCKPGKTFWILV